MLGKFIVFVIGIVVGIIIAGFLIGPIFLNLLSDLKEDDSIDSIVVYTKSGQQFKIIDQDYKTNFFYTTYRLKVQDINYSNSTQDEPPL